MPQKDMPGVSVDRLTVAGHERSVIVASQRDEARGRMFYGWVVIAAGTVLNHGFTVVASPDAANPFHAEILFPEPVEDIDDRIRYGQQLADMASWRDRAQSW